jgi:hypothetical protein
MVPASGHIKQSETTDNAFVRGSHLMVWNDGKLGKLRVSKDLEGTGRDLTAVTIRAFVS